jgi:DNA (cytosine-5)-methyltransferase 1
MTGSLFTGIGGWDLGLERAGMRVAWQCEQDAFCRRILAKHWPGVPCYPDVRELDGAPAVDVLCGGFPCQPVSRAGLKLAQADERWLWPEFARVVGELRPDTSSWRTSQVCLDGDLATFSGTWPRSGMTRSGTAFRLSPSVPLTREIASGSWPTPTRSDALGGPGNQGRQGGMNLRTAVVCFPTPVADDTGHRTTHYAQGGTALSMVAGGPLNPPWVEWLMGFPIGWTELPPSETPSSRRSRSGSAGESSKSQALRMASLFGVPEGGDERFSAAYAKLLNAERAVGHDV